MLQYSVQLKIGDYDVDWKIITFFSYAVSWDHGSKAQIVITDYNGKLSESLLKQKGNPTIPIEFTLSHLGGEGNYKNIGTAHKLYIDYIGQTSSNEGLAIKITAYDLAYFLLKKQTSSFSSIAVNASGFLTAYMNTIGLTGSVFSPTNDLIGTHRAHHQTPGEVLRYELDRVLDITGKPQSVQFDDRAKIQILFSVPELGSKKLDSFSGGNYAYGINKKEIGGLMTSVHHYEMGRSFANMLWGHKVTINTSAIGGESVSGSITAGKISGIKADMEPERRITIPQISYDSPTNTASYARSTMVNVAYRNEISSTRGSIIIDPDFKAFDDVTILNKRTIDVILSVSSNDKIEKEKCVVMGFAHTLLNGNGTQDAKTKILLRKA